MKKKNYRISNKKNVPEKQADETVFIRLNKFIADAGVASRRKADELIKNGSVRINDNIVTELGTMVKSTDKVSVNGDQIKSGKKLTYILMNKPKDYITTTKDEKDRKTVMDIIPKRERLFPVGRLDRNTTGVLLITNDGELAYRLTHPKYQIERIYNVTLDKTLKTGHAKNIAEGVEMDDDVTSPCEVFIHPEDKKKVTLTLTEGKNREVRRIFELFGYEVKKLDRKYFANLSASGMNRGEYRYLSIKEVLQLKKIVKLS